MKTPPFIITKCATVCAVVLLMISCSKSDITTIDATNSTDVIGCWTDSYEENTDQSTKTYRPCNYKTFNPSRYRMVIDLRENNLGEYLQLAPNDAHYLVPCFWSFDETINILRIIPTNGNSSFIINVHKIEKDKLLLSFN